MQAGTIWKELRVKFQRFGNVRGKVGVIVAAGIEMKFMHNVACSKNVVESGCSSVEAIVVLVAAIEIDFQASKVRSACNCNRALLIPECRVRRTAKRSSQHSRPRRLLHSAEKVRQFINQRG